MSQKNKEFANTLMEALGIEMVRCDKECVVMTMPVHSATRQPFGLLHGGASVALAETAASFAGHQHVDPQTQTVVGMEINANHVRGKRDGVVTATAAPVHVGRSSMVFEIRICDENNRLVCISRCTLAVVKRPDVG